MELSGKSLEGYKNIKEIWQSPQVLLWEMKQREKKKKMGMKRTR